jgi:hypothetical protein
MWTSSQTTVRCPNIIQAFEIAAARRLSKAHTNMKESSMTTKNIAIAKSGEGKISVDWEALAIILAFTVLGGTVALVQGSTPQATSSANVQAKNLDRCPYYPTPVFCRSEPRSPEQDMSGL